MSTPYGPPPGTPPPAPYGPSTGVPAEGGFYEPAPRRRRSPLRWVLVGIGVLGVLAVLFLGFVAPGWFSRTVFDAGAVQQGVERTLKDSYGIRGVGTVTCPPGQPVEPSHAFDCRVRVGGQQRTVTVTVTDDRGTYRVGRPE